MPQVIPSDQRAEYVLQAPKEMAAPMSWGFKHGNRTPPRHEFRAAVYLEDGATLEGVFVVGEWRKSPIPGLEPCYQFGIICDTQRIFAFDINPHDPHRNKPKIGTGRPFYGQKIEGDHVHIWTGIYGYAEPLPGKHTMTEHWHQFCLRANLKGRTEFTSPDFDAITGQGKLL